MEFLMQRKAPSNKFNHDTPTATSFKPILFLMKEKEKWIRKLLLETF